jgi:hypothetical protein
VIIQPPYHAVLALESRPFAVFVATPPLLVRTPLGPAVRIFNRPRPFNFREGCDDADNRRQLPSTAANRRSQTAAVVRQTIWMHLMRLGRRAWLDEPRGAREGRTLTRERRMTKGVSR